MTAPEVLQTIKAVHERQMFKRKPFGLDTLFLILNVDADVLLPLIDKLKTTGEIVFYPSKSAFCKRGPIKYGTVSVVTANRDSRSPF